jgi:hypothetical protein
MSTSQSEVPPFEFNFLPRPRTKDTHSIKPKYDISLDPVVPIPAYRAVSLPLNAVGDNVLPIIIADPFNNVDFLSLKWSSGEHPLQITDFSGDNKYLLFRKLESSDVYKWLQGDVIKNSPDITYKMRTILTEWMVRFFAWSTIHCLICASYIA